jgi:nicotinamide mononucleotide transporter
MSEPSSSPPGATVYRRQRLVVSALLAVSALLLAVVHLVPGALSIDRIETWGFVLGLWAVGLTARNDPWCWPTGIAMSAIFVWVFTDVRLFADAGINVWYVLTGIWGWWWWLHGGPDRQERRITHVPRRELAFVCGLVVLATALMYRHLVAADDPNPLLDGFTASLSMGAYWLQARRYVETWHAWIAVDVVYVPLYWVRELPLTAVLYAIFMLMCVFGLRHWRRLMEAGDAGSDRGLGAGLDGPTGIEGGRR